MYTFDSKIRYSEVDSEGKLSLAALINYFQDCSTFQSEELGNGVKALQKVHQAWVLSAWQIVVERLPELCERVTIGTAPYEMKAFLGSRNYAMWDAKGNFLAKANSLWSFIDTQSGYPVSVPPEMRELYKAEPKLDMEYAPRKITIPKEGGSLKEAVVVQEHHLDTNHHVNNQQYIAIALHYLSGDFVIRQMRAEYKKQAFLGDVLLPRVFEESGKVIVVLENEDGAPYVIVDFTAQN